MVRLSSLLGAKELSVPAYSLLASSALVPLSIPTSTTGIEVMMNFLNMSSRPTALQDRMRDSDEEDVHDRDYDVAALANNLSQAFRYTIYDNDDAEEVRVYLMHCKSGLLSLFLVFQNSISQKNQGCYLSLFFLFGGRKLRGVGAGLGEGGCSASRREEKRNTTLETLPQFWALGCYWVMVTHLSIHSWSSSLFYRVMQLLIEMMR